VRERLRPRHGLRVGLLVTSSLLVASTSVASATTAPLTKTPHAGQACNSKNTPPKGFTCVMSKGRYRLAVRRATPPKAPLPRPSVAFALTSPAFGNGGTFPAEFTCAANNSPHLVWSGAPTGTMSFALVLDDPDAVPQPNTTFVHWITYNIPATATGLPAETNGPVVGLNDGGTEGYLGPCPPAGTGVHHYHFHLYALNVVSPIIQRSRNITEFRSGIAGNVIQEAQLTATVAS
jgi:Raf kinase inhibitor-like YbhB/YbcL family protein